MSSERRDNRSRHFILDREDVVKLAVISLRPAVGAGQGIDELRGDADATAAAPYATLQYIPHAQVLPDVSNINRLALVLEGRIACDDQELGKA
jgi:hypothetical protein